MNDTASNRPHLTPKPIRSKFASVTAHNKYGIPRSSLIYMMQNQFYFDKKYSDCLWHYFILQWECKYFCEQLAEGMLEYRYRKYQVIYHRTDPTRIRRAKLLRPATSYVKLSFRVAQNEFNIPPVVLVKLYNNPEGK